MKIIKHFYYIGIAMINRLSCKHFELKTASCPYTGLTYTSCGKCLKRIKVEETQNGQV